MIPAMTPAYVGSGRRRLSWPVCLFGGVIALGLLHWSTRTSAVGDGSDAAIRTNCEAWDREASEGIAAIISDNSAAAELRLDQAILQLRRARKNCRAGFAAVARHDYASLHQAFPSATGSIRAAPRDSAPHANSAPLR
jgi:hypothetical protein